MSTYATGRDNIIVMTYEYGPASGYYNGFMIGI